MQTGAHAYPCSQRALLRSLSSILFCSHHPRLAARLFLAFSSSNLIPGRNVGYWIFGIVDAIRVAVWSIPCATRLGTAAFSYALSSAIGIAKSPLYADLISSMRAIMGPRDRR